MHAVADAVNDFTLRAYAPLARGGGNCFFSGASLRAALGLAYPGARGATREEMARVLGLERDAAAASGQARAEVDSRVASGARERPLPPLPPLPQVPP